MSASDHEHHGEHAGEPDGHGQLGHWMEMRAIGQAGGTLQALAELLPDGAERVTGDGTQTVEVSDLTPEDVVLGRPAGRVPADGQIVDGQGEVDESMIRGESNPLPKETGDGVVVALNAQLLRRVDLRRDTVPAEPSPAMA